ncbi:MAG: hypothetical protein PHD29_01225 [bacterium]|nr:hypothetical protein [bacterium]MDD5353599.1 hypothetical protein [bacterium]MDD5755865.1 hypothetical protein [bacterium]
MSLKRLLLACLMIGLSILVPRLGQAESIAYYQPIIQRNIFKPLWDIKGLGGSAAELEKARLAEEQRQAELKAADEQKQLEAKKQELQKVLFLSGIVYNGKKYSALITDRRTSLGGNYQVGDIISDIKVTVIDADNKTVTLSDEGKFNITLKVGVNP